MCCNCSVKQKKFWLWGSSIFVLILALVFGLLWPFLFGSVLKDMLQLRVGSLSYDNWVRTPLPMFAEFHMFHWTNPQDAYDHTKKPHFVEKGPYVFEEVHTRDDVQFFDNATVAFNQTRLWHFREDLSQGSLDDEITNLNTIAMTVGYTLRHEGALMKIVGEQLMNWAGEKLAVTHTVRELIFDGYDDKILDVLRRLNLKSFDIPFDRFGWFVDRNGSSSYDGRFHMRTGEDDIKNLGLLQLWNLQGRTAAYPGDCGLVRGTTGELWPPESDAQKTLTMFIGDVCRSLQLKYDGEGEKFGVRAQRFRADESVLDNGRRYEEAACYCTADAQTCPDLAPGVMNVSTCKFGAPAFLSFPHFYLADESYREQVEGMVPDEALHSFYMLLVRSLGVPMEVRAGIQINLMMDEYFTMGIFKGLPRKIMPMFWFQQRADITEELAKSAYWAAKAADIGLYVAYGLAGVAVLIMLIGAYLSLAKKWTRTHHDDDDELLTD